MAQTLDPLALLRDLVGKIEKRVNDTARPLMGSPEFSRVANQVMAGVTVAKQLARNLTQRYFEALNVPSRADIVALADRLQALEDRIIGIQATLDQMAAPARPLALPGPRRTRKPPEAVAIEVSPMPAALPAARAVRRPARTRKAPR